MKTRMRGQHARTLAPRCSRGPGSLALAALLASAALTTAHAQVTLETADVVGQGPGGPLVAADGAWLRRSDTGLTASLRMPTPLRYDYPPGNMFQPDGAFPGHPEAFSLWVIVFNNPEDCFTPFSCNAADFSEARGTPGAFSGGGHLVAGPTLTLSGRVTLNSEPFPVGPANPLLAPRTAEVHLAVAPHGALQPHVLPNQISTPLGGPQHWWFALFRID